MSDDSSDFWYKLANALGSAVVTETSKELQRRIALNRDLEPWQREAGRVAVAVGESAGQEAIRQLTRRRD